MENEELFIEYEKYFTNRGWTFDQAAKRIGVSRSTLFNWKNGQKISAKGVSAIRLLVSEPMAITVDPDDHYLNDILKAWGGLSKSEKMKAAAYVQELLEKSGLESLDCDMGGNRKAN